MIRRVISGGQTGADQGGLLAARDVGVPTGGWAPQGWRVDGGVAPWLATFGLKEHPSSSYPPRTEANVHSASVTLFFGDDSSPGARCTRSACERFGKPFIHVPWPLEGIPAPRRAEAATDMLRAVRTTLYSMPDVVLNVAGNRERTNPGIEEAVRGFVGALLALDRVVHMAENTPHGVYVGRAGKGHDGYYGNPCKVGEECPVCRGVHVAPGETLVCFEAYATRRAGSDPEYRQRVADLYGQPLVCFCAPGPCHAEVLSWMAVLLARSTSTPSRG